MREVCKLDVNHLIFPTDHLMQQSPTPKIEESWAKIPRFALPVFAACSLGCLACPWAQAPGSGHLCFPRRFLPGREGLDPRGPGSSPPSTFSSHASCQMLLVTQLVAHMNSIMNLCKRGSDRTPPTGLDRNTVCIHFIVCAKRPIGFISVNTMLVEIWRFP